MPVKIEKVLIAGAGTMGQQIGFQCAMRGFRTVTYDVSEAALESCRSNHRRFAGMHVAVLGARERDTEAALGRLEYSSELAEAARDADLVSESVPEDPEIKRRLYADLHRHCPERTILTTNSSTLVPSQLADATGRPGRFLALPFANPGRHAPIGEVMGHPGTEEAAFERVVRFAREIGMVPIPLAREHHGYVINSLLMPFLEAGLGLVADGVTSHETVDRTWMIATRMAMGPFGIMDLIGLETIYNVTAYWARVRGDRGLERSAAYLKERHVDRGRLGIKTGEGFYSYPDPAYGEPGFVRDDPRRAGPGPPNG